MNLLPLRHETFVSPHTAGEIISRLKAATSQPTLNKQDIDPEAIFIGQFDAFKFRLSIKISAPENFLPIIIGSIDETTIGCIIYLKFKLFFSSLLFLVFWSSVSILICFFFYFIVNEHLYALIALVAGLSNYFITYFYFHKKVSESYKALLSVLKMDK